MAKDKRFDDIFADTAAPKPAAPRAAARRAAQVARAAATAPKAGGLEVDRFLALDTALASHHGEALQRREREDRYFFWATALIAAILLVAFVALYGESSGSWFFRLVAKLVLASAAGGIALHATSLLDTNRRKIRDLMGVVVKINERLGFFQPGLYDDSGEPFYPSSYKFSGAEGDDETDAKTLFLKVAAAVAAFLILVVV